MKLFGGSDSLVQLDAMAYGAGRQYLANLIAPVTSSVPLGNFAEPVTLGVVDWFIAKNFKGFIGDIAKKGLIIENAAVGAQVLNTGMSVSSGNGWVLGYDQSY